MASKRHIQACLWCDKSAGLCEYSGRLKPVAGWDAEEYEFKGTPMSVMKKAYKVKDCPKFKLTEKPERNCGNHIASLVHEIQDLSIQMCGKDGRTPKHEQKMLNYGFTEFFARKSIRKHMRKTRAVNRKDFGNG